jgi:hypothetical protein
MTIMLNHSIVQASACFFAQLFGLGVEGSRRPRNFVKSARFVMILMVTPSAKLPRQYRRICFHNWSAWNRSWTFPS